MFKSSYRVKAYFLTTVTLVLIQWSYGVTLWEVMMRGRKPYPGIDNLDMKRFLLRGQRLDKPSFCPDIM